MGCQCYSSRGLSQSRDLIYISDVSCLAGEFFTASSAWGTLLKGAPEPKCEEAQLLQAPELPWQGPGARDAIPRAAVVQAPCRPASLAGGMWRVERTWSSVPGLVRFWEPSRPLSALWASLAVQRVVGMG